MSGCTLTLLLVELQKKLRSFGKATLRRDLAMDQQDASGIGGAVEINLFVFGS
jgi:hypothetical protein